MMGYTKSDITKMKRALMKAITNSKTGKEQDELQDVFDLLDGLLVEGHIE